MQSRASFRSVVRTPEGFTVHGHHPLTAFGKLLHEPQKPLLERLWIQHSQHPRKGVVAGNAVFQFQKGLQKLPLGLAEKFHVGAGLATADDGAQGNDQNVMQGMAASVDRTRVLQVGKYVG